MELARRKYIESCRLSQAPYESRFREVQHIELTNLEREAACSALGSRLPEELFCRGPTILVLGTKAELHQKISREVERNQTVFASASGSISSNGDNFGPNDTVSRKVRLSERPWQAGTCERSCSHTGNYEYDQISAS